MQSFTMIALTLLAVAAVAGGMPKFEAYDCTESKEVRLLAHESCLINQGHKSIEEFVIIQENKRRNITGYKCEIKESTIVDYCGHYSSTKATGESRYHVAKKIDGGQCREMVSKGTYEVDGTIHNVRMDSINHLAWFTHGSVKFDGSNIQCVGEPLRLMDGQVNQNMIRQITQAVKIQRIDLMVDGDEVLTQAGVVLGPEKEGTGMVDMETVIWDPAAQDDCKLRKITTMKLETRDGVNFINNEHMIKLVKKQKSFNQNCKMTYYTTNDDNIHMMEIKHASELNMFDKSSVHLGSHIQTQLDFLDSKVATAIKEAYSMSLDPECHEMNLAPLHKTMRLPSNKFTRNLGDVSVVFRCQPTTVELNSNTSDCHAHPPVITANGKEQFIDPETRIIVNKSVVIPCTKESTPIMKAKDNKFYAITPLPIQIIPDSHAKTIAPSEQETHGLYTQSVISQWLDNAYIAHIHKSLTNTFDWQNKDSQVRTMVNSLTSTYEDLKNLDIKEKILGFSWDHIGAQCGIISLSVLTPLMLYWLVDLSLRIMKVHRKDKPYGQTLLEAGFGHLTLLAERHNQEEDIQIM